MDVADYSTVAPLSTTITIGGYKRNGEVLTYSLDPTEISLNFKNVSFGPEWQNLDYVIFNGGGIAFDNLVLKVTDELTQFDATNMN